MARLFCIKYFYCKESNSSPRRFKYVSNFNNLEFPLCGEATNPLKGVPQIMKTSTKKIWGKMDFVKEQKKNKSQKERRNGKELLACQMSYAKLYAK